MEKTREWLLYNAVLSWLTNYGSMGSELNPDYQLLEEELRQVYEQDLLNIINILNKYTCSI